MDGLPLRRDFKDDGILRLYSFLRVREVPHSHNAWYYYSVMYFLRWNTRNKRFSAEVNNMWVYTSTPTYMFTAWCLV
jgi:hypothetical protein